MKLDWVSLYLSENIAPFQDNVQTPFFLLIMELIFLGFFDFELVGGFKSIGGFLLIMKLISFNSHGSLCE